MRPKVHYTATSCSRRGPLRYVCGQTIAPTAMICTSFESPTDLDVHPRKRFAVFVQNRRNWHRRSMHTKERNLLVARTDEVWVLLMNFFYILVCNALLFSYPAQISRIQAKLTYKSAKYRVCLLCLYPGGVHCVTFAVTPITAQQNYGSYIFGKPQ